MISSRRKSIYLQNHQTEMDWLYAQYIYQAFGKEGCFSAIMKGSLRYSFSISVTAAPFP